MIDFLTGLDEGLLLLFNGHHTPVMDEVMWIISGKLTWIPFYVLLLVLMSKRIGWKKSAYVLVGIALAITLADQICGSLLRGAVGRLRPSNLDNPLSALITVVHDYRGGKYGFPSCHAANTMALAVMMILVMRTRIMIAVMLLWSLIVSCSRMYLGVHYPSDILTGWIIGGGLSFVIWYFGHGLVGLQPYKPRPALEF